MTEQTGWAGRVALVLGSSTGGIGRHVASLAAGLVEAGVPVTVHGPADTGALFGFADPAFGVTFRPVEIQSFPDGRAVGHLRREWTGHPPPDVVHAHGLRAGLVAARARTGPVPLVVTWHNAALGGGLRGRAHRLAERYLARTAEVTLGASADLVALATRLGARRARLGAVAAPRLPAPRRSPAAVRAELGVAPGVPLVLSVGRLHPQKDYPTLIRAAARWREREPVPAVVIAGSGPSYLDLAAQISEHRAPVTLLGHRTDIADLLAAADLAVVASVWEARQLFAQEALRAGVPLVATAVGGIPDLVGDAAVLVPPGDPMALADAVADLLDDEARRVALGERGAARATTWPVEEDTVAQVLAVYQELTGELTGREAR